MLLDMAGSQQALKARKQYMNSNEIHQFTNLQTNLHVSVQRVLKFSLEAWTLKLTEISVIYAESGTWESGTYNSYNIALDVRSKLALWKTGNT
jgi:hypothetical protein